MKTRTFHTKVIAYRKPKEKTYVSIALNFDLVSQGKSLREAMERLNDNINSYLSMCIKENEPDNAIYRHAPKKYIQMHKFFLELQKSDKQQPNAPTESYLGTLNVHQQELIHG